MSLKHPIQFIKKYQINITLFLILCVLSYFIYKKHKGILIEGSDDACSSSPASLCNFNMEIMKLYFSSVNNIQKQFNKASEHINGLIQKHKNKVDEKHKELQQDTGGFLKTKTNP